MLSALATLPPLRVAQCYRKTTCAFRCKDAITHCSGAGVTIIFSAQKAGLERDQLAIKL